MLCWCETGSAYYLVSGFFFLVKVRDIVHLLYYHQYVTDRVGIETIEVVLKNVCSINAKSKLMLFGNLTMSFTLCSVNVSPFMWAKLGLRLAMHAGSCTAWNMGSSQTDRCPVARLLEEEMTPSIPSSVRLGQESMSPGPSLLTWNLLSSVSACYIYLRIYDIDTVRCFYVFMQFYYQQS